MLDFIFYIKKYKIVILNLFQNLCYNGFDLCYLHYLFVHNANTIIFL